MRIELHSPTTLDNKNQSGRFNVYFFSLSLLCYHKRFVFRVTHDTIESKNRLNYFIYYFIKVLLFDGTETTIDIAFNVARDYLTFHKAGL